MIFWNGLCHWILRLSLLQLKQSWITTRRCRLTQFQCHPLSTLPLFFYKALPHLWAFQTAIHRKEITQKVPSEKITLHVITLACHNSLEHHRMPYEHPRSHCTSRWWELFSEPAIPTRHQGPLATPIHHKIEGRRRLSAHRFLQCFVVRSTAKQLAKWESFHRMQAPDVKENGWKKMENGVPWMWHFPYDLTFL